MKNMTVWDVQTTNDLIAEYRKHRILWDLLDPDYRNGRKKKKLWKRIAMKLRSSPCEIKTKIKNLRTTYHRYRRFKLGRNAGKEKWLYFDSLRFLSYVDMARKKFFLQENCDVQLVTERKLSNNPGTTSKKNKENKKHTTKETDCNLQQDLDENGSNNTERVSSGKHERRESSRERRRRHQKSSNKCSRNHNEINQNKGTLASKRDELSTFSEHIANEIRKLRSNAQSIVKYKINNILFDAAMGKFDVQDPSFLLGSPHYDQQNVIQSQSVSSLTMPSDLEESEIAALAPMDPALTLESHHEHNKIGLSECGLTLN